MKTSKPLALFLALLTAVAVLSGSVAVPILCRPFYYAQIAPLELEAYGLPEELIRQAFDEMMDYCTGQSAVFSTGVLGWSAEGKAHFDDVRSLFLLDLWTLGLSLIVLALCAVFCRCKKVRPWLFKGHGPGFWGAIGLGAAFLAVALLAALDFNRAFVVFHLLFFPGKDNWLFDPYTDQIILFLPEAFFCSCAVLILALLLTWCGVLIAADLWAVKHRARLAADTSCGSA